MSRNRNLVSTLHAPVAVQAAGAYFNRRAVQQGPGCPAEADASRTLGCSRRRCGRWPLERPRAKTIVAGAEWRQIVLRVPGYGNRLGIRALPTDSADQLTEFRIRSEACEGGLAGQLDQVRVVFLKGSLEPFERSLLIVNCPVRSCDVVR